MITKAWHIFLLIDYYNCDFSRKWLAKFPDETMEEIIKIQHLSRYTYDDTTTLLIKYRCWVLMWIRHVLFIWRAAPKENRIYIRGEFTRKKCKTAILLYCFHIAGVLHIFARYNLLGPGTSFYKKSKINIKRKQN